MAARTSATVEPPPDPPEPPDPRDLQVMSRPEWACPSSWSSRYVTVLSGLDSVINQHISELRAILGGPGLNLECGRGHGISPSPISVRPAVGGVFLGPSPLVPDRPVAGGVVHLPSSSDSEFAHAT